MVIFSISGVMQRHTRIGRQIVHSVFVTRVHNTREKSLKFFRNTLFLNCIDVLVVGTLSLDFLLLTQSYQVCLEFSCRSHWQWLQPMLAGCPWRQAKIFNILKLAGDLSFVIVNMITYKSISLFLLANADLDNKTSSNQLYIWVYYSSVCIKNNINCVFLSYFHSKGVRHEIFRLQVFSWISLPRVRGPLVHPIG